MPSVFIWNLSRCESLYPDDLVNNNASVEEAWYQFFLYLIKLQNSPRNRSSGLHWDY